MLGFVAIGGDDLDAHRVQPEPHTMGPTVSDRIDLDQGCIVRTTNPKFLDDKVLAADDEAAVALDGVIFNLAALRQAEDAPDNFQTLKRLYQQHGDTFFTHLRGEWAGALYDRARRRWVAFTNQTASKPLFYYARDGLFACSTQFDVLAQVLRDLGRGLTLDEFGAYCLLTYGYMIEDATLVSEIRKLKAGQYLTYEGGQVRVEEWLRLCNEPYLTDSKEDIIERVDDLFKQAVAMQYEKDRACGYDHLATLSGGLDSRMNVMVAQELGYRPQVVMTFSQTGYWDMRIANRIARDLGLEFIFYALDGGDYLHRVFFDAVRASGGLVLYGGSAHLLSALKRLDTSRVGMLHTGMIGDAVLGSFLTGVETAQATLPAGAYSTVLLDRIASDVQAAMNRYETEDEFLMYNRGCNGALNGNWTTYQVTECTSPFLDVEFLTYCMRIPRLFRNKEQIYIDWIMAKHPAADRYVWEKTRGARPSDGPVMRFVKKYLWAASVLGRGRWDLVSMNPLKSWEKTNATLMAFMEAYWRDHAEVLDDYPELRRDCERLFRFEGSWKRGSILDKTQVMTLVEAIRMIWQ